jgi:aminopeptidase N
VPLTVWSQGEPITNRHWIPARSSDEKQTSEMFVTVADGFTSSQRRLVAKKPNADKSVTFHWKQEQPHVSYLITLVVGQFDIVEEKWKDLPVLYYVPKGRKEEIARTFGRTREMLDLFSRKFGIDYPWEKYAQVVVEQFTAGGMENTSATTLHDRVLHDERSMLDHSPDGLIAHELAHQWWGDLVTCRDWSHLWLNEGFASMQRRCGTSTTVRGRVRLHHLPEGPGRDRRRPRSPRGGPPLSVSRRDVRRPLLSRRVRSAHAPRKLGDDVF